MTVSSAARPRHPDRHPAAPWVPVTGPAAALCTAPPPPPPPCLCTLPGTHTRIPARSALDTLLEDERWADALDYNIGAPMPHEGE